MKSFSTFHPVVLFLYYVTIVFVTFGTKHPLVIGCSMVGAILFFKVLHTFKLVVKELLFYGLFFFLIAIPVPLFSHNGVTALFFLNNNAVTLEAITYGCYIAIVIIVFAFWCKAYIVIFSLDKLLYVFSKISPKFAILLSMFIRFIPLFKQQFKNVHQAQRVIGFYTSDSFMDRLLAVIRIGKSTLVWSFENAFNQAEAMKARGYGLKGRTSYSIFRMHQRDYVLLISTILVFAIFLITMHTYTFYYYPEIAELVITSGDWVKYATILVFMLLPTIIEVKENVTWSYLQSKI